MSSAELDYSFITPYPDMIVRGREQVVEMRVERAGAVVEVTELGSTFSLLKPDGTAVVDADDVVVDADGVPQYTLTALLLPATLTPLGEGWQEVWELVLPDGTTRTVDREAALCLRPLVPVVSQATLSEDYPTLATFLGNTAHGGIASWQDFISSAWADILGRLIAEGHLPYLVKSSSAFRKAHKELAYSKGFGWLAMHQSTRGNWLEIAEKHSAAYEAAWKAINFKTDDDHDGRVDDDTRRRGGTGSVLHLNAAPARRTARLPWL